MLKKILAILLVMVLSITSCFAFVSCDKTGGTGDEDDTDTDTDTDGDETEDGGTPETPEKVNYTVTVLDSDGTGVMGAKVQLFDKDKNLKLPAEETDIDGKVTFTRKAGNYTALLTFVSTDYVTPDYTVEYSFTANNALIRVDLKVLPRYTITVVDQYGNPVVGARVQACKSSLCVDFADATNEFGESSREIEEDSYQGKINTLPAGYSERPGTVGQYYSFTGDAQSGFRVTIVVAKV